MPTVPVSPRRVQETALPAFRVQSSGDVNAFGGGIGRATDKLGQIIEARATERQKEIDHKAVLDISNQFDADNIAFFHDKDKGLFSQKMDAAQGSYEKATNYFKEKTKQYEGLAQNENQRLLLMDTMNGTIRTYLRNSSLHEAEQFQASRDATTKATINTGIQGVAANYGNPEGINSFLDKTVKSIIANANGKPKEVVQQEVLAFTSLAIGGSIDAALDNNDISLARKNLNDYGKIMDPGKKAEYNHKIFAREEKILINQAAKKAVSDAKTFEEALANAKAVAGLKIDFDTWKANIIQDESGGNYDAQSSAGAKGKYQIMPATWKQWAPKVGLPEDTPMTPENQEKVGTAILRHYYDTYGPYAGAVAFYAGDQNGKRVMEGKTTLINDEGQEYSLYAPQGKFPSVDEYAKLKLRGGINAETEIKLEAQVEAEWSDKRTKKAWAREDAITNLKNSLATTTGLLVDKFALIDNAPGLEPYEKAALKLQLKHREESDIDTRALLNKAFREKTLTTRDVENVRDMLKGEDYLDYLEKAEKITGGKVHDETIINDKKWSAELRINGPYPNDAAKNNKLEVEITDRLDQKGIKGADRYPAAMEMMNAEKKEAGSILFYTANNNITRKNLVTDQNRDGLGEKRVQLAEIGFKRTGSWDGNYGRMQNFFAMIDQDIKNGDPYAKEAMQLLLDTSTAINDQTYRNAYDYIRTKYPELANKQESVAQPSQTYVMETYDPITGFRSGSIADILKREGLTWIAPAVMKNSMQAQTAAPSTSVVPQSTEGSKYTPGSFLDRVDKEGLSWIAPTVMGKK